LSLARQYRDLPEAQKLSRLQMAHKSAASITSVGSQVGDTRPLSSCNFAPNSEFLATGSFTGNIKVIIFLLRAFSNIYPVRFGKFLD